MIKFFEKNYDLLFSNQLAPLQALNYSDELFFKEFERLTSIRYRILSIIVNGWQRKYGLIADLEILKKVYLNKISEPTWIKSIFDEYEVKSLNLRDYLKTFENLKPEADSQDLLQEIVKIRELSAPLDAMSNLLHLFSALTGDQFLLHLSRYTKNPVALNKNFIYYTQPIQESRYAKIVIPNLPDKVELDSTDHNFSNILRVGAFIKDDVRTLLDERQEILQNLFRSIALKYSCDQNDFNFLTIDELATPNSLPKILEIINKRREQTVLFYQDTSLKIFEGSTAKEFLTSGNYTEIEPDTIKTLHGQCASLGEYTGPATIARTSEEASAKMSPGDVLVAPYTAVEYLPAMKKAGAIITETGGITSHAAIVARELGIPCLIAVPDATKIIKNGTQIKLNAELGTIEIL